MWLAAVVGSACLGPGREPLPPAPTLAFEHVNIVRLSDASIVRDTTLVVAGELVSGPGPNLRDARRIDARGWYVIPGLWDMHVHLDEDAAWALPVAAAAGVTGMRDMGGRLDAVAPARRLASAAGMPRLLLAGPIVTGPVDDADERVWPVRDTTEATRAAARLADARVDHVKVHDWLTPQAWRSIVARARADRVPVVGHLPVQLDALEVAGQQKSIEHLGNAWGGFLLDVSSQEGALKRELRAHMARSTKPSQLSAFFTPARWRRIVESFSPEKADALADRLARDGTFVCPTLYTFAWLAAHNPADSARRDPRLRYLPASRRGMLAELLASGESDADAAGVRARVFALQQRLVRTLHARGVRLLAGTDYAPYPLVFPGFSLHDELQQLVGAGLTPADALRAATVNVGRYLDDRTVGCLDEGCRADAVFLDANPLDDIRGVARVSAVLVAGHYLDPESRRQRLLRREREAQSGGR